MEYNRLKDNYKDLIKISNMSNTSGRPLTGQIPVDRRHSVLGNPFSMENEAQRMNVLQQYQDYLDDIVNHYIPNQPYNNDLLSDVTRNAMASLNTDYWLNKRNGVRVDGNTFMNELDEIRSIIANGGKIDLTDWCAPKPCHAETIGNYIGDMSKDIQIKNADIMTSPDTYILQQVNAKGVMGRGLAAQIKPDLKDFDKYKNFVLTNGENSLGYTIPIGSISNPNRVYMNIVGQNGYGTDKQYTDYNALNRAFNNINNKLPKGSNISIPYGMGAGLGGGDWNTIDEMIKSILGRNHNVTYYKK